MPRRLGAFFLFAALLGQTACSDAELVGLHINLRPDGSGVMTARALSQPTDTAPAENRSQGVVWQERAALTYSQGTFASLANLKFGEIRWGGDPTNSERPGVRVFVPRGPEQTWVQALVPDLATRRKLAKVYDPTGKMSELGGTIRLELQLPANVIAAGVQPKGRGIDVDYERNRAWLVVTAQAALEKGEELVWDVSWVTPH